jgi:hypothetical protein
MDYAVDEKVKKFGVSGYRQHGLSGQLPVDLVPFGGAFQ